MQLARKSAGLRIEDTISLALTAPGTIWRDMIIMGFRTAESAPAAPGAEWRAPVRFPVGRR